MKSTLYLFTILFIVVECHWYKCPDIYQDACTPSKCSSNDADKRALFKCDVWPYWSGGWGTWSEESESYSCINSTDKYCSVWRTQETKFRKNSTGTCFYIDNDILEVNSTDDFDLIMEISPNYCSNWICSELQVFTECEYIYNTETKRCEDLLDEEYNECQCIESSLNNQYCTKWQCLQIKNGKIEETANYLCDEEENNKNLNYCGSWTGDIEQEWEFELLDCECDEVDSSSNFCVSWNCDEREMTKHYSSGDKYGYFHAIFWPLFIGCLLGGSCASGTKNATATYVTVAVILVAIGVVAGGIGFLMIWLIILVLPLLLVCITAIHSIIDERNLRKEVSTETDQYAL